MKEDISPIIHDKDNRRFTMNVGSEQAKVEYTWKDNKMYLVHSEVPHHLRGKGIGKILVEKTFEKLTEEGYQAVAVCGYIKIIARRSATWNTIIG